MARVLIEDALQEKKPIVVFLNRRKPNLMRPMNTSKTFFYRIHHHQSNTHDDPFSLWITSHASNFF